MKDLTIEGLAIAPGVVETIVSLAAAEVEGVASVGQAGGNGLLSVFSKNDEEGVVIEADENDELVIAVHVEVNYGSALPELAASIRSSIDDAITSQLGLKVASIDVYVDGIHFVK